VQYAQLLEIIRILLIKPYHPTSKRYIDKNTIYVNDKELLCDDYIVICKNKGSNELEILGNVRGKEMAVMIMPLADLVLSGI